MPLHPAHGGVLVADPDGIEDAAMGTHHLQPHRRRTEVLLRISMDGSIGTAWDAGAG